jgi:hypothetical protein
MQHTVRIPISTTSPQTQKNDGSSQARDSSEGLSLNVGGGTDEDGDVECVVAEPVAEPVAAEQPQQSMKGMLQAMLKSEVFVDVHTSITQVCM